MDKPIWLNFCFYSSDFFKTYESIKIDLLTLSRQYYFNDLHIKISHLFGSHLVISILANTQIQEIRESINQVFLNQKITYDGEDLNLENVLPFRYYPNNHIMIDVSTDITLNGLLIYKVQDDKFDFRLYKKNFDAYKLSNYIGSQIISSESDLLSASLKWSICLIFNLHKINNKILEDIELIFNNFILNAKKFSVSLMHFSIDEIINKKKTEYDLIYIDQKEYINNFFALIWQSLEDNDEFDDEWMNYYNREIRSILNRDEEIDFIEKYSFQLLALNTNKLNLCDDNEGLLYYIILKLLKENKINLS